MLAYDKQSHAFTELVPTLGTRSETGVAGSHGVRRLTPVECERLQGFPDGWTDGESDAARYRALGNAVCAPVAAWIFKRLNPTSV